MLSSISTSRVRARRARIAGACGVAMAIAILGAPRGEASTPAPVTSPVVAKVGAITITAADLERRMASVPGFQLKTFGKTPAEVRQAFLERVLVREALLSQAAEDRHLETRDDVRERERGILRTALLNRLRAEAVATTRIDDAEVQAYYDKNAAKFHTPERYAVWIIVTRKREEAKDVIDELKKDPSPKKWTELTRAHSVDGATASRGGNVGFVAPDGTTQEPGLHLNPPVIEAVKHLKDAEFSQEPIKDQDYWVVAWRKQTMPAVTRGLDVEGGSIRQMLLHARSDGRLKEMIAELRKEHLTERNPDLVDLFDITAQGDMTPVRRPGALPNGHRIPAIPMPSPALR